MDPHIQIEDQIDDSKITEITEEIIGDIIMEYPRIQSLDFSEQELTEI